MKKSLKVLLGIALVMAFAACDTAFYPGDVKAYQLPKVEGKTMVAKDDIQQSTMIASSMMIPFTVCNDVKEGTPSERKLSADAHFAIKLENEVFDFTKIPDSTFTSGTVDISELSMNCSIKGSTTDIDFEQMIFGVYGEFDSHAKVDMEIKDVKTNVIHIYKAIVSGAANAKLTGEASYNKTADPASTTKAHYKGDMKFTYGIAFSMGDLGARIIYELKMRELDNDVEMEQLQAYIKTLISDGKKSSVFDDPRKALAAIYGDEEATETPYFTITAKFYDNKNKEIGKQEITDLNLDTLILN